MPAVFSKMALESRFFEENPLWGAILNESTFITNKYISKLYLFRLFNSYNETFIYKLGNSKDVLNRSKQLSDKNNSDGKIILICAFVINSSQVEEDFKNKQMFKSHLCLDKLDHFSESCQEYYTFNVQALKIVLNLLRNYVNDENLEPTEYFFDDRFTIEQNKLYYDNNKGSVGYKSNKFELTNDNTEISKWYKNIIICDSRKSSSKCYIFIIPD
jgi:hypothetical protein